MYYKQIMDKLKSLENQKNIDGMARFGLSAKKVYGVPMPVLRKMAKDIGKNHEIALKLWKTEVYDARMIACMIEDPKTITEKQMDEWVNEFDSWGICDTCCGSLFDKTEIAYRKVFEWAKGEKEFVRRAGFATIAWLALHDKKAPDSKMEGFLPIIKKYSTDERNMVKKAVNWALRQIGKRNLALNKKALRVAKEIKNMDSKSARWIASDAIRELESDAVQKRLREKAKKNL